MLDSKKVSELKEFVSVLKADSSLLHLPELDFFREYLLSLGASLPKSAPPAHEDPELIAPESDAFPPRPEISDRELSDSDLDAVADLKTQAAHAAEEKNFERAVALYTQVMAKAGASAMVLTKRAEVLLHQRRPRAAMADCHFALELNPSSGKAFRIRGMANRFLGHYEEAHADLAKAQAIDYDEETEHVKRFVDEKWKLIKKPHPTASTSHHPQEAQAPSGMPDMGALFSDPEIAAALGNPKVMAAFQQMMTNPAAIFQYQNDPEVGPILMKLMSKMGMPGGMGGFPNM